MDGCSRFATVLARLDGVRPTGGGFVGRCPVHHDRKASLSVSEGDDGKVLLFCHAGCTAEEVVAALGLKMSDLFPRPPNRFSGGRMDIAKTYDYRDEQGVSLYQGVRLRPKGFRQRRPDGQGGWIWDLKGVRYVPYRLPELLEGVRQGATVFVVEGEKDCERLTEAGLVATTNAMGAGKWRAEYCEFLKGATVVVLPDNDQTGIEHAHAVARSIQGVAASVKVVPLPGLPEKGDVSDYLNAGGTVDGLLALVAAEPEWDPELHPQPAEPLPSTKAGKKSEGGSGEGARKKGDEATRIVELADEYVEELFHTPEGDAYVTVPHAGHSETWPIDAKGFREWLAQLYFVTTGSSAGGNALRDALGTLAGLARFHGEEKPVFTRVAEHEGAIYLALCDRAWRAIRVDSTGWEIVSSYPVKFRRASGMLPLPVPERGGSIEELRSCLNVEEAEFPLMVAWLLSALRPRGPYLLLEIRGEQGSAKTTAARVLRSLVDPNVADLRVEPKDAVDLAVAAKNGWVIAYDNLSTMPVWLSDGLCRLSTGGGLGKRRLYTDDEEALLDAKRPALWTGIGEVARRPDLLERAVLLTLPRIPKNKRKTERQFWRQFAALQPRLLGALLDALVVALRRLDEVALADFPRMADVAEWVVAAEPGLGWAPGTFLAAYTRNQDEANATALEGCPVTPLLRQFLAGQTGLVWEDTASTLLEALAALPEAAAALRRKEWPTNAQVLSRLLKRIAPNLRATGISIEFLPREGSRRPIRLAVTQTGDGMPATGDAKRPEEAVARAGDDGRDGNDAKSAAFSASVPPCEEGEGTGAEGVAEGEVRNTAEFASRASFSSAGEEPAQVLRRWMASRGWPQCCRRGGLPIGPGESEWERWLSYATLAQVEGVLRECVPPGPAAA